MRSNTVARSVGASAIRLNTSDVAACRSRASCSSSTSRAISAFAAAGVELRGGFGAPAALAAVDDFAVDDFAMEDFGVPLGAPARFRALAVRPRDFADVLPAPERRFIACPEAQNRPRVRLNPTP